MSRPTSGTGPAFAGPARPRHAGIRVPPPPVSATDRELAQNIPTARRIELLAGDELEHQVDELATRLEGHAPIADAGRARDAARRLITGGLA